MENGQLQWTRLHFLRILINNSTFFDFGCMRYKYTVQREMDDLSEPKRYSRASLSALITRKILTRGRTDPLCYLITVPNSGLLFSRPCVCFASYNDKQFSTALSTIALESRPIAYSMNGIGHQLAVICCTVHSGIHVLRKICFLLSQRAMLSFTCSWVFKRWTYTNS